MTKTALVTGAAGLVGSTLARLLDEQGYRVTRVDTAYGSDARDFFRSDDSRYSLVIHAAAHVGGRADIDGKPLFLASRNLTLDGAMFEWALRTRPEHVCFFSSSASYPIELQTGDPAYRLREDDVDLSNPRPADASYGEVKLMGERLAAWAAGEGLRAHVFRPFSGFDGWRQSPAYPFPSFVRRAVNREAPFTIWGTGEACRDWVHIDDVARAVLACVDQDVQGPINLCTGRATSFTELADLMCEAAGYSPEYDYRPDAPQGVQYRVGDPTKLNGVYESRISIEQAVAEAVKGSAA